MKAEGTAQFDSGQRKDTHQQQRMIIKPRFGTPAPHPPARSARPETAARDHDLHAEVEAAVRRARSALIAQQHADGHWVYELEADCTIPAEYILMNPFMDEVDEVLERKIAHFLRDRQAEHGGWPLYHGGDFDLSCSVKAYYALKLAGDDPNDAHMIRARTAILAHGGAERCNVFTRIALALFEQVPWRAVPFIPAEVMLLPRWFPFHISRVSYWSRTVMVPLFILCTLKPKAANPRGVDIRELFVTPPEEIEDYFRPKNRLAKFFLALDKFGRWLEPFVPRFVRRRAIHKAERWFIERLNGTDGLGGIFPAMVNSYEALAILGYPADHPHRVQVRTALRKLLVTHQHGVYCQPCVSPVWDTGLAAHALFVAAGQAVARRARRLARKQARPARRWLGVPVQQFALSRSGRHFHGGVDHVPRRSTALLGRHRARRRLDLRHAIEKRRLCLLRCRQHALLPQRHSVRGSRRPARSADRGRDRALHRALVAGQQARVPRPHPPGDRVHEAHPGGRRLLVRPLGHELHLRHLVGALRPGAGGRGHEPALHPARRAMAGEHAESRRRLGRKQRQLLSSQAPPPAPQHAVPDRMGAAGADLRRLPRHARGPAGHPLPAEAPARGGPVG